MITDSFFRPLFIVIGFSFFGTAATMNYAIVAQSVPSHLSGRVTTAYNLVAFLLAFLIQWGIGAAISMWDKVGGNSPFVAYQYTLMVVILLQVLGLCLWASFKPWRRRRNIFKAQRN